MTEQEIERCLERFTIGKATDVMNFDYAGTLAYIQQLKSENAALRERLEKAVEMIEKNIYDDFYFVFLDTMQAVHGRISGVNWVEWSMTVIEECTGRYITFRVEDGNVEVYVNSEAAEARLAELKGGKE